MSFYEKKGIVALKGINGKMPMKFDKPREFGMLLFSRIGEI
jgi:hypothetical protein